MPATEAVACLCLPRGEFGSGQHAFTCVRRPLRGTTTSRTKRLRETFILVSTVGMLAFFLQTVAVFASMNIDWPLQLDWIFEFSFVFMSGRGFG